MRFEFKDHYFQLPRTQAVIFGILNVTPDSFSDGGKYIDMERALEHALLLEQEGADVIDVGGESSRPGSRRISGAEEMERVIPIIRILRQHLQIPISIDTNKSGVAEAALAEGASIVNDVSGLRADPRMASVVAARGAGLILMHSRGTPSNMQTLCNYENLLEEVTRELLEGLRLATTSGIPFNRIALDPGIGFAKSREQSLELLRRLDEFLSPSSPLSSRPLMVGVSRKSFLGGHVDRRIGPTVASELWAWQKGAQMIRTHDVGTIYQAIRIQGELSANGDSALMDLV